MFGGVCVCVGGLTHTEWEIERERERDTQLGQLKSFQLKIVNSFGRNFKMPQMLPLLPLLPLPLLPQTHF